MCLVILGIVGFVLAWGPVSMGVYGFPLFLGLWMVALALEEFVSYTDLKYRLRMDKRSRAGYWEDSYNSAKIHSWAYLALGMTLVVFPIVGITMSNGWNAFNIFYCFYILAVGVWFAVIPAWKEMRKWKEDYLSEERTNLKLAEDRARRFEEYVRNGKPLARKQGTLGMSPTDMKRAVDSFLRRFS